MTCDIVNLPARRCGLEFTSSPYSRPRRTAILSAGIWLTRLVRRSCWARTSRFTTLIGTVFCLCSLYYLTPLHGYSERGYSGGGYSVPSTGTALTTTNTTTTRTYLQRDKYPGTYYKLHQRAHHIIKNRRAYNHKHP